MGVRGRLDPAGRSKRRSVASVPSSAGRTTCPSCASRCTPRASNSTARRPWTTGRPGCATMRAHRDGGSLLRPLREPVRTPLGLSRGLSRQGHGPRHGAHQRGQLHRRSPWQGARRTARGGDAILTADLDLGQVGAGQVRPRRGRPRRTPGHLPAHRGRESPTTGVLGRAVGYRGARGSRCDDPTGEPP